MRQLLSLPLILSLMLLVSCTKINTDELNRNALTKAQTTIVALNDLYIPSRTTYEQVYNLSSEETKKILNKKVNPYVNKANDVLIYISNLVLIWTNSSQKPEQYDTAIDEAKTIIPEAVSAMADAIKKPE